MKTKSAFLIAFMRVLLYYWIRKDCRMAISRRVMKMTELKKTGKDADRSAAREITNHVSDRDLR